eukprot:14295293-Alexandrium_andersonii.AAC.1
MFFGSTQARRPGPCSSDAPKRAGQAHVLRAHPSASARPVFFGRTQAGRPGPCFSDAPKRVGQAH